MDDTPVRLKTLCPDPDRVLARWQPQLGLATQKIFAAMLLREHAVTIGPDDLKERKRGLAVEPDGRTEERLVPPVVDALEDDWDVRDVASLLVGFQALSVDGPTTQVVEDWMHHRDVQAEHGQLRYAMLVPQPNGKNPAWLQAVCGDPHDLPAALADCVDGRPDTGGQVIDMLADDTVARDGVDWHG